MTFWVAGASILGGVIGGAGARSAANTQADAATNAANIQAQSAREAQALQKQMFDQQMAGQEPFRQAGITGQNRLMEYLGLGGNAGAAGYGKYGRDFGMSDFQSDPGYAFRLGEGQKALERSAAARGGLISGGALKAATRYGQDMGSQEYQNAFQRYQTNRSNQLQPLGNLMAMGQSAASNQGSAAGNYGNAGANLITGAGNAMAGGITGAGNAQAAGQMGMANTFAGALGTAASGYQNQTNFNNWMANQPKPGYNYMYSDSGAVGPPSYAMQPSYGSMPGGVR
jgi:hypothetical protein